MPRPSIRTSPTNSAAQTREWRFHDALKLVKQLVNIGVTRTLCGHSASTTHRQMTRDEQRPAGVSVETIRLSVGLEHAQDIVEDLDDALDAVARLD